MVGILELTLFWVLNFRSRFNEILISRSNAHLRAVFEEYEKMSKNTVEEALKKEMSGDLLRSFLSIVRCIQNKPAYFAKTLNRSMKGLGTDDKSLSRVIITRCEIDMVQIKTAFAAEYGKSLAEWIKGTSDRLIVVQRPLDEKRFASVTTIVQFS
ncbi:unnamed protein product [Schistocephalus solidus]|uniref:Annexin n=1 Tax=Schistocephalus solidus TaxID=70667 RepID=A0A3P7D5P5_SCHSO|nr:unnamed protein product [Schistocephalus solidus]